jgi:hypothetical protein
MSITEKLRELIPNGYGHNSEFAHTMEAAAIEIERLRQGSDVLRAELAEMSVIRGIDDRFGGRLALMLECAILNPNGYFDEACALLDEYKAEWEKVNPSPPTFLGKPIPNQKAAKVLATNTYHGRTGHAASFAAGMLEDVGAEIRTRSNAK